MIREAPNEARFTEGEIAAVEVKGVVKMGEEITKDVAKKLEGVKDLEMVSVKARVTHDVVYLNSFQEERMVSAAATTPMDTRGYFTTERVPARVHGQPTTVGRERASNPFLFEN